jgi:uncharacterized membrane protein
MSLEERLGTQWAVWVGGVAVVLGGIFLVRYSIEQGLLGPGVRVTLGALLAVALVVAGEWTRRGERLSGIAGLPTAHIPSILTAAGTTVAYADVYAAYALYGFLGPGSAFIMLGLVALATLAAALLHGQTLAGLGLVGAYLTPLLVASEHADYWSLYIYLAVVTAAAFALARVRMWRWLAIAVVVFSAAWTLPGVGIVSVDALGAHLFHVVTGFALAAALIVAGLFLGPDAEVGRIDGVSSAALGTYLVAATLLVLASRHDPLALATFAVLVAATVAIAWRAEPAAAAVPAAALLAALVIVRWAVDIHVGHLLAPSGPVAGAVPEPPKADVEWHLLLATGFALLFGTAGYRAQGRSQRPIVPILWSASAVFAPVAILAALYYRIANLEPSIPFAASALLLSVLYALATEQLDKRPTPPGARGRGRAIRHRGGRRARARAHHGAREGLAHDCARADGCRHRLGRGQTSVAGATDARRRGRGAGHGAHRLGPTHRRAKRRNDADLQLAALRLRHSRRRLRCGRPSPAPPRRRRAGTHDRFRCHRVDGAAGVFGNPPLHLSRRHLPQ